jgi:predicted DNA-binding transcriptional regulator AlpA
MMETTMPQTATSTTPAFSPVPDPSLTINEFLAAEKMCRSMLYKLWNEGKGPRSFTIGTKRMISAEARLEWRRARETETAKVVEIV